MEKIKALQAKKIAFIGVLLQLVSAISLTIYGIMLIKALITVSGLVMFAFAMVWYIWAIVNIIRIIKD